MGRGGEASLIDIGVRRSEWSTHFFCPETLINNNNNNNNNKQELQEL